MTTPRNDLLRAIWRAAENARTVRSGDVPRDFMARLNMALEERLDADRNDPELAAAVGALQTLVDIERSRSPATRIDREAS